MNLRSTTELTDLINYVVRGLCDTPTEVVIEKSIATANSVYFIIYCHPDDRKRVIGKQGKNINSIRTLLHATGAKLGVRTYLSLVDN